MKKLLSILLAMAMAVTLFAFPAMAKPYFTTNLVPMTNNIFEMNFEDNSVGTQWKTVVNEKTGFYHGSGGTSGVETVEGNNSVAVTSNNTRIYAANPKTNSNELGVATDYNLSTYPLYGSYTTEFKFMLNTQPTSALTLYMADLSTYAESTNIMSPGPVIQITSGLSFNVSDGSGVDQWKRSIMLGRWYTVRIDNDILNRKYDVYVNGVLVADDAEYVTQTKNYISTYGEDFKAFNRPFMLKSNSATVYLDDVRFYKEVEGRKTFIADDFSGNGENVEYPKATLPEDYASSTAYDSTYWQAEFAGMTLDRRAARQKNVVINATDERAVFSAGARIDTTLVNSTEANVADTEVETDRALSSSIIAARQLTAEFKFTPTTNDTGMFYQMTDAQGSHYGVILSVNEGNFYAMVGKTGDVTSSDYSKEINLGAVSANTDYNIKVSVDLDKEFKQNISGTEYTRHGLADIYINGKLVGESLPLCYNCNTYPAKDITNLGRAFSVGNGASVSAPYYIDNLAVYTDVREKILFDAMYALDEEIVGASVALPGTTETGYTITWSSDDITVSNNTAVAACTDTARTVTLTASVADTSGQHTVTGSVDVVIPAAYEVEVTYKNAEDAVVSAPVAGGKLASVKLIDNNNSGIAADIYAAVYVGEGQLDSVKVVENASAADSPVDIALASGTAVKLFVWAGDGTLKPLALPQTITVE